MTQLDDMAERIAKIEERMANLTVDDLPMASLQRKLESSWQPSGSVLLEPHSITSALTDASLLGMAGRTKYRAAVGTATLTIPNTASAADGAPISHGLGATPSIVLLTQLTGYSPPYLGTDLRAHTITATTFTPQGTNLNGYASGISLTYCWLALAAA